MAEISLKRTNYSGNHSISTDGMNKQCKKSLKSNLHSAEVSKKPALFVAKQGLFLGAVCSSSAVKADYGAGIATRISPVKNGLGSSFMQFPKREIEEEENLHKEE
jgi:hypothetical protein